MVVEVPVRIDLGEASSISLDANGDATIKMHCSIAIPVRALVDALAAFQKLHESMATSRLEKRVPCIPDLLSDGRTQKEYLKILEERDRQAVAGGAGHSLAFPPGLVVRKGMDTGTSKQMLATGSSGQAATSRTALEWLDGAPATHPQSAVSDSTGMAASGSDGPASGGAAAAAPAAGGHTAEDVAKQGKLLECLLAKSGASITPQEEITWDTEIEKLYYKEEYFYPIYRAATTWTAGQGRTERSPVSFENHLINYKPLPLQPVRPQPKRNYWATSKTGKQAPVYAHGPAEAQVVEDPPHPPPRRGMRWEDNPLRKDCQQQ